MKYRITVLSILLILLIPAALQADRQDRLEFSLQTLYTSSKDYSGDGGSSIDLDDNLGWGFGVNYHLHRNFDLGAAFRWRSINYRATAIDVDDPSNTYEFSSKLDVSTMALTADWNILNGPITPYVNGSIGWTIIDTNIVAGYSSGCWWHPWYGPICDYWPVTYGKNTASFSLGVGGRFQITDSFFIKAGYEYGWLSSVDIEGTNMFRIDFGFLMSPY